MHKIMIITYLFLLTGLSLSTATGIHVLFPELRQYNYVVKTNISTGVAHRESYWTLEGRLLVLVYDNFTRVQYKLEGLKTSVYSDNAGYSSYQSEEATKHLETPWEVVYQENGFISALHHEDQENVWVTNIKRAISINFQLRRDSGSYTSDEPCLYDSCVMVYNVQGNTIKKYSSYQKASMTSQTSWSSVPWSGDYGRGMPENIVTSQRVYELYEKGLNSLNMKGIFQYMVEGHILTVLSELSLYRDSDSPLPAKEYLIEPVRVTNVQYVAGGFDDPTNGIKIISQDKLRNTTYEILLKIARKGIDADNIVRDATLIHSMNFIDLLNTITKLHYSTLIKLFEDLVLGTSYDLETARNIFLEVIPHGRSEACAKFIKYLVVDEKEKIEDTTLLSLIRKLPFNIANHSQALLQEMETFSKLGLDFPQEIRHAGILSFAIMVAHGVEVMKVKQDYFDSIVVKYFRMYSDCPQYLDRLIWLQGLCSLGYTSESYIRTIYSDKARNRHERLWASLACGQDTRGYNVLETSLPILMDDTEHIQLRISALHSILSSGIRESDFLFLHNWISTSRLELQRFWYSTVKSLENNKFIKYRTVSDYIPFVSKDVTNPDSSLWGTNNYIVSGEEQSAWVQLMSVGNPAPSLAALSVSTGGRRPYQASVYVIAEGVSSNLFKKMHKWKSSDLKIENLLKILERMKVWSLKTSEEVHIDIVIKIHDKTVFATHVNQTRFESWNGYDLTKSITEFLRFGSHINQQVAYYPIQMDVNIPSELGTPIRLQSSVVSFTSIRGNLTSNPDSGLALDWVNDLHIRQQATTTTTLSTSAPLLQSEHEARVQRSMVAHLPIKFNVTMQPSAKSVALTWLNPFAQRAGIAIHSWVRVHMDAQESDVYTVSPGVTTDDDSIFFDCERKTSGAEVIEKYIMSKFMSYDLLPTKYILNSISRFISSCGVIIPPTRPAGGEDEMVHVEFTLGDIVFEKVDKIEVEFEFMFKYYSIKDPKKQIFLKIDSNSKIKSAGRNLFIKWFLYVDQPYSLDPKKKFWKLCYTQQDTSHAPSDQDITINPSSYHGTTKILYHSSEKYHQCDSNGTTLANESVETKLQLNYNGTPRSDKGNIERYVEVDILGENLHQFDLLQLLGFGVKTPVAQLLGSFDKNIINTTAVIKEKDGTASIRVNGGVEVEVHAGGLSWLLDSWTAMQLMRRFGLYRECRLQESTVQTLSGSVEQLQPLQCYESLVLADCSVSPSFVILRQQNGGIQLYDGDYSPSNATSVYASKIMENKPSLLDVGTKIMSEATGVILYKRFNETVILIPSSYMHSVCGECAGQKTYNNC